jgi:hypothetical protein
VRIANILCFVKRLNSRTSLGALESNIMLRYVEAGLKSSSLQRHPTPTLAQLQPIVVRHGSCSLGSSSHSRVSLDKISNHGDFFLPRNVGFSPQLSKQMRKRCLPGATSIYWPYEIETNERKRVILPSMMSSYKLVRSTPSFYLILLTCRSHKPPRPYSRSRGRKGCPRPTLNRQQATRSESPRGNKRWNGTD